MKSSFKSVAFFKQLIIFFLSKAQKGENTKKKTQVVTLFGPELHKCALSLHLRFYLLLFFSEIHGWKHCCSTGHSEFLAKLPLSFQTCFSLAFLL